MDNSDPIDTKNTPEKLTKGHILALCRDNGLSIPDASKVLGVDPNYGYHIAKKLSQKYDLTSPSMLKLAKRRVTDILKAQPFGCVEAIKDSTVLQATQMVYDRAQPKASAVTPNSGVTFIQINLDAYKGDR